LEGKKRYLNSIFEEERKEENLLPAKGRKKIPKKRKRTQPNLALFERNDDCEASR